MEYDDYIKASRDSLDGVRRTLAGIDANSILAAQESNKLKARRDMFAAAVAPAILTAFYNRKIIGTGPGFEGLHMTDCVRQFIVGWTDAMIAELDKEEENG